MDNIMHTQSKKTYCLLCYFESLKFLAPVNCWVLC